MSGWKETAWGDEISLEYGKALRDYKDGIGNYRVYGSNGPVGWTTKPLSKGPGVILGRKGAYRGVEYSKDDFYVIDTAYYVVSKSEHVIRWLYYAIQYHKLGEIDDGSPVPSTTRAAVYVREFEVPPLPIQKKIAKILGGLDDKIENNRRMNETLEGMAQAIFKSWFVDFDPVRAKADVLESGGSADDARLVAMRAISGKSTADLQALKTNDPKTYTEFASTADAFPSAFTDSPLGPIPEGWEMKGLDQIANYLNGLALQKFRPKDENHFLPVLKIAQLKKGSADGAEKASPDIKPEYIVENGDVVFSWSGSLVVDVWCGGKAALNQHLFKVTSDKYPKWLYYLYTRHHLQEFQRIAADKAVTMGHIKREHLSQALCAVPKLDSKLMEICGRALQNNLSKQIELRSECTTLAETRDALLPKLLSGEIHVSSLGDE